MVEIPSDEAMLIDPKKIIRDIYLITINVHFLLTN